MHPFESLVLPNGATIANRIAKAAMEENMADFEHAPSAGLLRLYDTWAAGGAGLLISGNVMIDRRALTGPGGVVLEDGRLLPRFSAWAQAGRRHGAHFWLQLNHPGRQMLASLGQEAVAPSAVALELGALSRLFAVPRAMTEDEIADVIRRFGNAAALAERAGFTGVQIHAAHGYLLSQFLSPLTNRRNDAWGGSLENRARLLLESVRAVRAVVSPSFCVAVKLNSADFQRGGFDTQDARQVLEMLNALPVDLVELSGGSYEAPATQGDARDGRTLAREAYFLEFAEQMVAGARMPLMVTGGIRSSAVLRRVLDGGIAMAGIATAIALDPDLPNRWRAGDDATSALPPIRWKHKALAARAYMASVKYQLRRLGLGRSVQPQVSPLRALLLERIDVMLRSRQYRRWMANGQPPRERGFENSNGDKMKKLFLTISGLLLSGLLVLFWTFTPQRLPVPDGPGPKLPPLAATATIAVAETGSMESNAFFAYRGGALEKRTFGMDVFVVRHDKDTLLVEAGFGRQLAEHLKTVPWLMRTFSKVRPATPLVDQLASAGLVPGRLMGVYLTHAHWDHIGALPDMPGIPVFVSRAEREFIEQNGEATALAFSFGRLNYRVYDFDGPPFAGFPASHDVFGDGSVVAVQAAGHTPGSVIVFVRTAERDYALIGDQAWQHEGVDIPAEKPWISREMVDDDAQGVRANLVRLHQLQQANPRLVIVPSHDRRVTATLPRLSAARG